MTQDLHAYEQMRAQIMRAVAAEKRLDEIAEILEAEEWTAPPWLVVAIRKVLEQR